MGLGGPRAWLISLVPQGVANGLASLLVPLFLLTGLKGTVFEVGILAGASALALMPSTIFWGWLVDRSWGCKPLLILSFVGTGATLLLIPYSHSFYQLFALVTVKSVLFAASMPSRQILTVESESHATWQGGLARLAFFEGLGETAGLGLGFLFSGAGLGALFELCGVLALSSAAGAAVLVREPAIMIERKLLGVERFVHTLSAASTVVANPRAFSSSQDVAKVRRLFRPTTTFFLLGAFTFSLAAAALYSPLPAYFLRYYPSSSIFLLFFANTTADTAAYLLVPGVSRNAGRSLVLASAVRMLAMPVLLFQGGEPGFVASMTALAIMGGFWALFDVAGTTMFMGTARAGRAGLYGAIAGLGSGLGSILGGLISMGLGFGALFAFCALLYAATTVFFVAQFRAGTSRILR